MATVLSGAEVKAMRVAKTYAPDQDGAKRFSLRHGDALVCVRHRLSPDGMTRHTTIELLVESTPVVSRQRTLVALRLPEADRSVRARLMSFGALWDAKERSWLLPYLVAKNLRLLKFRVRRKGDASDVRPGQVLR